MTRQAFEVASPEAPKGRPMQQPQGPGTKPVLASAFALCLILGGVVTFSIRGCQAADGAEVETTPSGALEKAREATKVATEKFTQLTEESEEASKKVALAQERVAAAVASTNIANLKPEDKAKAEKEAAEAAKEVVTARDFAAVQAKAVALASKEVAAAKEAEVMMASVPTQQEAWEIVEPMLKAKGKPYKKFKQAFLRKAKAGEKVETFVNGKLETQRVAKEGDWVVRADTTSKERYIISGPSFVANYDSSKPMDVDDHPHAEELKKEGFKAYAPTRRILAIEVDGEIMSKFPAGKFMAAWEETMIVEVGDFLAAGRKSDGSTDGEIVRIEKGAFDETYEFDDTAA